MKDIEDMTVDDFTHDYFNFETIDHPITKRLMKKARKNGIPITFEMKDGAEEILNPNESVEEFKQRVSK